MASNLALHSIHLIGVPSGLGGNDPRSGDAPAALLRDHVPRVLRENGVIVSAEILAKPPHLLSSKDNRYRLVAGVCEHLARATARLVASRRFFGVLGGDHSCAIGTWAGVARSTPSLGLIWIDAHLDSHTPATSPSSNPHGMPVAVLLGQGNSNLLEVCGNRPVLEPSRVCLIGVRSYEAAERAFLEHLGVRVYYIDEVIKRGLKAVVKEAVARVAKSVTALGISIDLDALDPQDAPGVALPVTNGLRWAELRGALQEVAKHPALIGVEVTEYTAYRDKNNKTARLVGELLATLARRLA
jgi:arginase